MPYNLNAQDEPPDQSKMTRYLYGLILIFGFSFTAVPAGAEVYRWVDAQGNVHFGDKKPADQQAQDISGQLKQQNIDESARQTEQVLQQIDQRQQALQTESQQRQNQGAESRLQREQYCQKANQRLKIMQGRVAFFDDNNQPVEMSEKERQQRAEALARQIAEHCH
jgi:multidrug efflux pump subunit AcrA (membrane-fusion protein)